MELFEGERSIRIPQVPPAPHLAGLPYEGHAVLYIVLQSNTKSGYKQDQCTLFYSQVYSAELTSRQRFRDQQEDS